MYVPHKDKELVESQLIAILGLKPHQLGLLFHSLQVYGFVSIYTEI